MLTAAFVGFMAAVVVSEAMPDAEPGAIFGVTPALLVGVLAAIVAGMLVSAAPRLAVDQRPGRPDHQRHRHQHHRPRPDRLPQPADQADAAAPGRSTSFQLAAEALIDLPLVGWIFKMFLVQGPITMSVIVLVIVLQILLFRSRWGLRTRAVGEHPRGGRHGRRRRDQAALPERDPRRRSSPGWPARG